MDSYFVFSEKVKELIEKGMVCVIRNEIAMVDAFGGLAERLVLSCANGYGASIIRKHGSYGYEQGLWELAVISNIRGDSFELNYYTDITQDVEGYLTCEEACKLIEDICKLNSAGRLPAEAEVKSIRKHRETVLTYNELAYAIASMNDAGIFNFSIRKMTDEEKKTMKVKCPNLIYFNVEYDATDDEDDAWDLLMDNPRFNKF